MVRKALWNIPILLLFAAAAPAVLRATDITYTVHDTVGTGTVTGTIVTDGTIGTLASGNFIDWDLVLTDSTGSADLLGPLSGNNSFIYIGTFFQDYSNNVTATATALQFDFNGNGGVMNIYGPTCSPAEWTLSAYELESTCNGTRGNAMGIASNDPSGGGTYSPETGEVTFATVATAAPEPGTFGLMLIGLASSGLMMTLRKRIANVLPTS
jgi:hypothetical protein